MKNAVIVAIQVVVLLFAMLAGIVNALKGNTLLAGWIVNWFVLFWLLIVKERELEQARQEIVDILNYVNNGRVK